MLKDRILHPWLLAAWPVLFLYAANIDQVSFSSVWLPLMFSPAAALILFLLFRRILPGSDPAAVMTSALISFFFMHGHMHTLLMDFYAKRYTHQAVFRNLNLTAQKNMTFHVYIAILLSVLLLLLYIFLRRHKKFNFTRLNTFLNMFAVLLTFFSIFNIIRYQLSTLSASAETSAPVSLEIKLRGDVRRDIYYIILDGYGRQDQLRRFYDYDNSPFIDGLKKKGFFVADRSRCNFTWTFLSLTSSLNLEYIDYLAERVGTESKDLRIPYQMIRNNQVARFLKQAGYQVVHFNSTWGATLKNPYADRSISYEKGLIRDEFMRILFETSAFKIIDAWVVENLAEIHLNSFEMLKTIPDDPRPTFTFCHMVIPHHPYVFDRHGNVTSDTTMLDQFQLGGWKDSTGYAEQVRFVSKKMLEVVDVILAASETEPIIIIQSDHGPGVSSKERAEYLSGRMSILNALLLPDGGDKLFYPEITPVNTFRNIFDYYFGTDYGLLTDTSWYSTFKTPLKFTRLSDKDFSD